MDRTPQLRPALDGDLGCAGPPDGRAHAREREREADGLGLASGVLDHRGALGEGGRHQELLGRPDRGEVEDDLRPPQSSGVRLDVALVDPEVRAEALEAAQMKVDGTRTDGAAAGRGDACPPETCEERTQDQERRSHRLHEIVRRLAVGNVAGLDDDLPPVRAPLGASTQVPEDLERGRHVGEHRHVLDHAALAREQRREEKRQSGVLRATHRHLSLERPAAPDHDRVHRPLPRLATSTRSMPA